MTNIFYRNFVHYDAYGNVVKRPKHSHPYNYDHYVTYQIDDYENVRTNKEVNTVYSDRLFQWNSTKYNKCCLKHFQNVGQYWSERTPEKIQSFLCDYSEKEIVLIKIMEYCNQSTGYPCWRFDYYDLEK